MSAFFGGNVVLATIVVAMLPLIELKGAIPVAMNQTFWGTGALSTWPAFWFAFLGSSLVVPVIALAFRPVYEWLKTKKFFGKILNFLVGDVAKRSDRVNGETAQRTGAGRVWIKVLTVVIFVAFPVPLTGVWTGTCFAVLLGLNFGMTCLAVIGGNAICGLIVTCVCNVFPQATNLLLIGFVVLVAVALIVKVILHLRKGHNQTNVE